MASEEVVVRGPNPRDKLPRCEAIRSPGAVGLPRRVAPCSRLSVSVPHNWGPTRRTGVRDDHCIVFTRGRNIALLALARSTLFRRPWTRVETDSGFMVQRVQRRRPHFVPPFRQMSRAALNSQKSPIVVTCEVLPPPAKGPKVLPPFACIGSSM